MEYWSKGVLEYWVLNALLHYSTTPVLVLSLWLIGSKGFAAQPDLFVTVQPTEVFQGAVAEIGVHGRKISKVTAGFEEREIFFSPLDGESHVALFGVDLEEKREVLILLVTARAADGEAAEASIQIPVKVKVFPQENLKTPGKFDTLSKRDLQRIEREQAKLSRLWNISTPRRRWQGQFIAPVPGKITSHFGFRRIINGIPRSPHGGVDLKAALGDEVIAANHGEVVLREELFFGGKSLVIDHGGGLYTQYFHLSEFRVLERAVVRQGDVIGLAGMTGRVTGPHLHWGARLNGARVDPFELLPKSGEQR
jgi:murein DD-endopeptidase MepM/ murein hydrolase activator NlpD